jgi:hypothetical protein
MTRLSMRKKPHPLDEEVRAQTIADIAVNAANAKDDRPPTQEVAENLPNLRKSRAKRKPANIKPFQIQFSELRATEGWPMSSVHSIWRPEELFRLIEGGAVGARVRKRIERAIRDSEPFKFDQILDMNTGEVEGVVSVRDFFTLGTERDECTSSAFLGEKLQRLAVFALKAGGNQRHASDLAATAWIVGHHWDEFRRYIDLTGLASREIEKRRKRTGEVRRKATKTIQDYFERAYLALEAKQPEWTITRRVEELVDEVVEYARQSGIKLFQAAESSRPYTTMRSWATQIEKSRHIRRKAPKSRKPGS